MKIPAYHHSMLYVLSLLLCLASFFIINSDARKLSGGAVSTLQHIIESSEINDLKHFDVYLPSEDSSDSVPYGLSSPFNLPPYDSLPPVPNTPPSPFCVNPPPGPIENPPQSPIENPPQSPSSTIIPSPPQYYLPPIIIPNSPPQNIEPSPPTTIPSPTEPIFSPPYSYEPSPPSYVPISPPISNTGPSPPTGLFLPPVVYPPPTVFVFDPIIQEAMDYACASGADCDQIEPNGSCYQPDTLFAHASYAFNSYWQRTKVAGGTCDFGGTAILVTVDPSFDGCQFIYY
ncbi:extensin [Lycium ferocissimum]|uniref:extensin n=1 Tax=Lycium ferocissimum TaxID=112874 RepID=UPI002815825B|nr:extensin [Lycium ferocissimum]